MYINLNIHVIAQNTVFVLFSQQYGLHSLFCITFELSNNHLFFEIGQKCPRVKSFGQDQKRPMSKMTKVNKRPGQIWSQVDILGRNLDLNKK